MCELTQATLRFRAFGYWIVKHRLTVLLVWAVVMVGVVFLAARAPRVLKGGAADIPASSSERAAQLLRTEFSNPYQFNLLVTMASDRHRFSEERYQETLKRLQAAAVATPYVNRSFSYLDVANPALLAADGHRTFFVVGLDARNNRDAEQMVPQLRQSLQPVIDAAQKQIPDLRVFVTGEIAIGFDATRSIARDTAIAERRILPVALLFLLVAFGALAAAGIPVLVGAFASLTTLALLYCFGHVMNLSVMAQNISSMVGLGIGIDYALIMVSRFREALKRGVAVADAVAETVSTSGQAVVYSGLTVMISFLALFFPGLIDTTSLAMAGSLTVLATVLLTLTFLPAVLSVIGSRMDWPSGFSRWVDRIPSAALWFRWTQVVMRRPLLFLSAGTLLMLAMSLPVATVQFGQFSSRFLPTGMPSGLGLLELENMRQAGRLYPINLVIKRQDGQLIIAPESLKALAGLVGELKASPRIAEVRSIVENAPRLILLNNLFFQGDVSRLRARFPESASLLISEDGKSTVIQAIPHTESDFVAIKAYIRELQSRDWSQRPGFKHLNVEIGGPLPVNNDFEHAILSNIAKVVGLVFSVTAIVLFLSFRSLVLPIKALLMNALSVTASFGMLILVFQHGYFASWIGFSEAPGIIQVFVPMVVFCCVFGLSMDYEVFLLSRIQEEYHRCGDTKQAVARGLAVTGGIITNAALIMLLVFGAFVAADGVLTKMIGFGLAVAVFLDALVIRLIMVPSFMALLGRWNWWPHVIPDVDAQATTRQDHAVGSCS